MITSDHTLNNCDCHLYPNPNNDVVASEGCILKKDYKPPPQQFHFQLRWKPQIRGYKYINMYLYTQLISAKTLIKFHNSPYIYIKSKAALGEVLSMSISCNAVGNLDDSWQDDTFIIHTG